MAEEQPITGQDPQPGVQEQVAAATPPAVEAAPALQDAPWSGDFNQIFPDEASRRAADQYMRTVVQPYQTKLEQEVAATKDGMTLYNDLKEDPNQTLVNLAYELHGQEFAQAVADQINGAAQQQQAAQAEQQAQYARLDPETQQLLIQLKEQNEESSYARDMEATIAKNPDINPDNLHVWVATADGDFDTAVELYRKYIAQFVPAAPGEVAPAVTGSDTGAAQSSAVPLQPKKMTMAEAIDKFMADNNPGAAPPVLG